jgi:EAL domain-containing protein (putative c-di-GMP-specific phosphodiesterase class I)/DNA-binding response OmpR family regulator
MTNPADGIGQENQTVLVIDDDAHLRGLVVFALRRASFEPIEAATGEAGLAILETVRPAVVVLDMGLPGMSGLEVIRTLRQRPATATLPILMMTGSGDGDTVLRALEVGADDFLAKPVRLDELVARVHAHVRIQTAWSHQVETELRARADVVSSIGRLSLPPDPYDAATVLLEELGRTTEFEAIGIFHLASPRRLDVLASLGRSTGVERGGTLDPRHGAYLVARARQGPWVDEFGPSSDVRWTAGRWPADLAMAAAAPIHAGPRIVGLLAAGLSPAGRPLGDHEASLLAEVIDFAGIISAIAGPALAQHGQRAEDRARLQRTLSTEAYYPVFQPIMDVHTHQPIGFEALTRFSDGTAPDVRFADATANDLGIEFETATLQTALHESERLPEGAFVSVNASPALALDTDRLLRMFDGIARPIVLELTEYAPIDDYEVMRSALRALGDRTRLSIDDAGAGYASLRHILELRPSFVKLDMSIVRGIDEDPVRQGLVAGLVSFAGRTGSELIAEGIETDPEMGALVDLDVRLGQGYLLGRPARLGPGNLMGRPSHLA